MRRALHTPNGLAAAPQFAQTLLRVNSVFVTQTTVGLFLTLLVSTARGDNFALPKAAATSNAAPALLPVPAPPTSPSPKKLPEPFDPTRAPARQNKVDADRLVTSRLKWEQLQKTNGGNYSYTVRWSSAFGFGHLTTITVRQNRVVERRYEEFGRAVAPSPRDAAVKPMPKWIETGSQLGTHAQEGAPVRTVDQLYAEAARLLSEPVPEAHQLFLGITPAGLLHHCILVDRRIMDDAPLRGVPAFDLQLAPGTGERN